MAASKEALASVHPIFRVHGTSVFWSDSVTKVNARGGFASRLLVIASPGLFLLEKRTFPKTILLARLIPFSDLLLVRLDGNQVDFQGPSVTIPVIHPQAARLVSIVWTVRKALFSDRPHSAKLILTDPAALSGSDPGVSYRPSHLTADRFLSFVLSVSASLLVPEQLEAVYDLLRAADKSFELTGEMAASPLVGPVCFALACDGRIRRLVLGRLNFPDVLPHFLNVILFNNSVTSMTFSRVTFRGSMRKYLDVWSDRTEFSVSEFIFEACDLSSQDFRYFIEAFENYPADMVKLYVSGCEMASSTLEDLCESFAVSPCFRTLTELSIRRVKPEEFPKVALMQLFSSNFTTEQQHLAFVDFSECALAINEMMPHFCRHETVIASISLCGNNFLSIDGFDTLNDFRRISELNFSSVNFTGESLIAMFEVLSKATRAPTRLVLDSLKLQNGELFYEKVPDIVLPSLEMFSFCDNQLSEEQVVRIMTFLKTQPNLVDLGLAGSLTTDGDLSLLLELIQMKPIRRLDFKGSNGRVFGAKLMPLFETMLIKKEIRPLDVTGQAVGNSGLNILTALAETCLEDLRCDRCQPSNYEFFIKTISRLSISCLIACEWPHQDLKAVEGTMPGNCHRAILKQLEVLRATFEQKLDPRGEAKAEGGIFPDVLGRSMDFSCAGRRSSPSNQPVVDQKVLSYRDGFVNGGLLEVFGAGHVQEPLLQAVERIEARLSFDALLHC
jgi:hypothetical protein